MLRRDRGCYAWLKYCEFVAAIGFLFCLGPYVCELFADSVVLQGFVSIRAPFSNKRDAIYRYDCLVSVASLAGT